MADKILLRFLGLRVKRREAKEEEEKRGEWKKRGLGNEAGVFFFFSQYTKLS